MLHQIKAAARALGIRRAPEKLPIYGGQRADAPNREDDLSRIYYEYRGDRTIRKWDHYLPIYDRMFAPYRNQPVRFLEIGVDKGGSLELWRSFFGSQATIFGIDIEPACARFDDEIASVRIGSQTDPEFLTAVADEMGGIDILLDDGSHVGRHQRVTFDVLFPRLSEGGLYVVEDLHTSYYRSWEGGLRRKGTFIEFAKDLVDDVNAWYHSGFNPPKHQVRSVQFFDAIVAIEKGRVQRPLNIEVTGGV
jgi:hypothetical protein